MREEYIIAAGILLLTIMLGIQSFAIFRLHEQFNHLIQPANESSTHQIKMPILVNAEFGITADPLFET